MFVRAACIALALSSSPGLAEERDWPASTPEAAGFEADLAERIDAALRDDGFAKLHSLLLVRDGKLVYERYFSGDDEKLDLDFKGLVFDAGMKHDVRSITKTVVGLLYGIALSEGKAPALDASIVEHFPEYPGPAADPAKRKITVGDALGMALGLEWNENAKPPESDEWRMEQSPEIQRYVLERPMAAAPGTTWVYSGGAPSLLTPIMVKGTGMSTADFAQAKLFDPLGIAAADVEWMTDYYSVPWSHLGLRMRPRDMAKLGQLVLDGGRWRGRQVVPEEWIAATIAPGLPTSYEGCSYGYLIWLCEAGDGTDIVEMSGRGGQEVLIAPAHRLVLVTTAGDYGNPDADLQAWRLLEETVLPALR